MTEGSPKPAPEGVQQQDPMQKALDTFQRRAASPKYVGKDSLMRALDGVRKAGNRVSTSPGELYSSLADLSGVAAETAGQHGIEEDQQVFTEQQQQFKQASEQLAEQPAKGRRRSTSTTNPRRTTGRAAG